MRKITTNVANAWRRGEHWRSGNTETDGRRVWLHGNLIAERPIDGGPPRFCMSGWPTPTTRERLNGLLPPGVGVFQHQGNQYLQMSNGKLKPLGVDEWFTAAAADEQ